MPSCVRPFDFCLSSSKSFFTNKNNHLASFFSKAGGRDKALKAIDCMLDVIGEISKSANAPKDAQEALKAGQRLAKIGRDAHSFFNIFAGIVPSMIENFINFGLLAKSIKSGNEVKFGKDVIPSDTDVKKYDKHRYAAALAAFGKGTANLAYILGFAICRPIVNLNKYIVDKQGNPLIHMGEVAKGFGNAFSTVMMANHIGGLIGGGAQIRYDYLAFSDAKKEGRMAAFDLFRKKMVDNLLGILENSLDLSMDIPQVFFPMIGKIIPPWYRFLITVPTSIIGCYKEWLKTG